VSAVPGGRVTERRVEVDTPLGPAEVDVRRPVGAVGTLLLTHGANGAIGTADLRALAIAVPEHGWVFALARQAWAVAGRRMPPPPAAQDDAWRPIVAALMTGRGKLPSPLVVGGRSNGARVACRTAQASGADGVLCLAFPLHPPGQPNRLRADELNLPLAQGIPTRVIQGSIDPFGSPAEVRSHVPDPAIVTEVAGGHGFSRRPTDVVAAVLAHLDEVSARHTRRS
jgi:predicted alpha/beta-hydrolase family hydrolase